MKNWKDILTKIGAALMSLLAMLAALPYQLGDVATIIAPEHKATIAVTAAIAACVLRVVNSVIKKEPAIKP